MTRLRLCLVQVGLCVLALFSLCEAIPPYPLKRRVVVKGPDGKDMPIFLKGDALSGRYETEDGYTVFEDPNQKDHWVYLREDTDYTWKDSTQPPTQKHLIPKRKAERMKRVLMARDIATGAPSNTASRWTLGASSSPETHTTVGERKVLVVGINFLDSKLKLSENAYWKTTFGESNSLKSFYERSSYKKLVVSPATEICGNKNNDGIAVVDLESTQPTVDTTEDDGMGNNFTSKVLEKLKACVDFESYDKNSDGVISADELTMIFVLPGREGAIACAQDKCHKTWAKYRYFGPLNQLCKHTHTHTLVHSFAI